MAAGAALCTRCGQRTRAPDRADRAQTRVGKPETVPPLPPAAGSIRWRNERIGEYSDRPAIIKCLIWLTIGLASTLIMRALQPGPEDLLPYLGRFGILTGLAFILVGAARMTVVDTEVSWLVLALGVAGSLAGADMAQHLIRDFLLPIAITAWPVAVILCAGLLVTLIDIELTEGALLGAVLIGLKLLLKFTLFEQMLTPP